MDGMNVLQQRRPAGTRAARRAAALAAAILLGLLGGCVLTDPTNPYEPRSRAPEAPPPASTAPVEPSDREASEAAEAPGATTRENETPYGSLTLDAAIRLALRNNPEVRAVHWDAAAAEAKADQAKAARWPSLHAVGGYTQFLNNQFLIRPQGNGDPMVFTDNIVSADLVVRLPIFTGGRITSEIHAADLLREAAQHRLARTREELVFNVTSIFYGILAHRHVIESLEFSQKALREHLQNVADLLAVQKAADVDRLRTEVRLADLKQQFVEHRNLLATENVALATLLGREDTDEPLHIDGALDFDPDEESPNLAACRAAAYENRDDYLAARNALEAQARRLDTARAAHWPTVALEGAYGGRWAVDPAEQPPGTDRLDDTGFVGVGIDVPIFEGGRISARVREERDRLAGARERLRKVKLAVRLEVESAVLNVASTRAQVLATETAITQGKESLRIEQEKYKAAKGSITDVLDAQSALLDTQTSYYRALARHQTALAQLRLAVGDRT